jgi:hypothetical protein
MGEEILKGDWRGLWRMVEIEVVLLEFKADFE